VEVRFRNLGGKGTFAFASGEDDPELKGIELVSLNLDRKKKLTWGKTNGSNLLINEEISGSLITSHFIIEPRFFSLDKGEETSIYVTYLPFSSKLDIKEERKGEEEGGDHKDVFSNYDDNSKQKEKKEDVEKVWL
jgi:hypothetical protein